MVGKKVVLELGCSDPFKVSSRTSFASPERPPVSLGLRAVPKTRNPRPDSSVAIARPIPAETPVAKATFFSPKPSLLARNSDHLLLRQVLL